MPGHGTSSNLVNLTICVPCLKNATIGQLTLVSSTIACLKANKMRYSNIPTFDMLPCDSERPESVKAEKDDFSTILAFESSITSENPGHFF